MLSNSSYKSVDHHTSRFREVAMSNSKFQELNLLAWIALVFSSVFGSVGVGKDEAKAVTARLT